MTARERPCPICNAAVAPRPRNRAHPFCSERCQLIDLGNWLDGTYAVPGQPADGYDLPSDGDENPELN